MRGDCRSIAAIQRYLRARPLKRKLTEPGDAGH